MTRETGQFGFIGIPPKQESVPPGQTQESGSQGIQTGTMGHPSIRTVPARKITAQPQTGTQDLPAQATNGTKAHMRIPPELARPNSLCTNPSTQRTRPSLRLIPPITVRGTTDSCGRMISQKAPSSPATIPSWQTTQKEKIPQKSPRSPRHAK
jgi:hypothetical protein